MLYWIDDRTGKMYEVNSHKIGAVVTLLIIAGLAFSFLLRACAAPWIG